MYAFLQVTSVSKKGEKFKSFVRGVLEAFSLQLELASFGEVGNVRINNDVYDDDHLHHHHHNSSLINSD